MRFMILMKSTGRADSGALPGQSHLDGFNDQLARAGVILAGERLYPAETGARVTSDGVHRYVEHGPFSPRVELITGFWLIQVRSREEAIEWAKRVPVSTIEHGSIEVRQVVEQVDFGPIADDSPRGTKIAGSVGGEGEA